MIINKKFKSLIILACAGIVLTFLGALFSALLPAYNVAAIVIAALAAAGTGFVLYQLCRAEREQAAAEKDIDVKYDDYCEIYYDKKTETAYVRGGLTELTGCGADESVLDDAAYKELVCDLISSPSDTAPDIYMAAKKDVWIRIKTFDTPKYELTVVSDVSEFVSCKNIIKTLKYYDSETGLLCRDAFISKVRSAAAENEGLIGIITILVSGIDRVTSFKGTNAADKVCIRAAAAVKRYENPHNAFAGKTSSGEFCLLLTDTYEKDCLKYATKLLADVSKYTSETEGAEYIKIYCGYAMFSGSENEAGNMLSAADYAVFEAKNCAADSPVAFDKEKYAASAMDFKKIQVFNSVVDENLLNYHFQPVVDAHSGEIFGYEALMRPKEIDGIRLSPLEMIEFAEKQGMTRKIEWLTISNTVRLLSENQDLFRGKKLFINSIPDCLISDEEYEIIFEQYSGIFDKLIIEITEGSQISADTVDKIAKRYKSKHAQIALDDYGTGYANESTLLSIKPDYIKIDRSLITGIDVESQKRHLVTNMINFAKSHGIKTLAEGVETRGELETVIILGVDLIQGFYTCKPNAVILLDVPADIKTEVLEINIQNLGYTRKEYRITSADPVNIVSLAAQGYTDLNLKAPNVNLIGSASQTVNMRMFCDEGYGGAIYVKDVNIDSKTLESPVLTLSKNCEVMLKLEGENHFGYEGIRVPQTSRFILNGDGNLDIDAYKNDGAIIGGSCMQSFGEILIDTDGKLHIEGKGDNVVAIGGGNGVESSAVNIVNGDISAALRCENLLAIGALSGTVSIKINNSSINVNAAGQNAAAIGSRKGTAYIECNADITVDLSGDNCCGIGILERGGGSISVGGDFNMIVRAKNAVCIGGRNSKADITVNYGNYNLSAEGNTAVGIGDPEGAQNVTVLNGIFNVRTAASRELPIGTKTGRTVIQSGNINIDSGSAIKAFNPYGDLLEPRKFDAEKGFRKAIIFGGSEYTYSADPVPGENSIIAYLPAGYNE